MPRLRRIRVIAALSSTLLLLPVTQVHASTSAYSKVLASYKRTGTVAGCSFSSAELQSALKGVDTYGAQYFADFTNAIQAALAQRASGGCQRARHGGSLDIGNPHQRAPAPPASITAATGASLPAPMVLLCVLAALVALIGGIVTLAYLRGWDPGWAVAWRHAWAEAGYRTSGALAELRDRRRSRAST